MKIQQFMMLEHLWEVHPHTKPPTEQDHPLPMHRQIQECVLWDRIKAAHPMQWNTPPERLTQKIKYSVIFQMEKRRYSDHPTKVVNPKT